MGLQLHLHLRPSMICLFLFIINIILVHVATPVSAIDDQYLNCSTPFRCGDLDNIGYPFWGGNRLEYCGYPGFELKCENDVPEITIIDETYRVLKIDNTSREVTVAREDYWGGSCPSNLVSTALNFRIFNYAPGTINLTLYYSCPGLANFMNDALNPFQFRCNSDETTTTNYFYSRDVNIFNSSFTSEAEAYFSRCANSVVIPTFKSTLESMVNSMASMNLTRALQEGFGLQWSANDSLCDECKRSQGQCGYGARTGQFNCYGTDRSGKATSFLLIILFASQQGFNWVLEVISFLGLLL